MIACSTPAARLRWAPYFTVFTEASTTTDYIALYDYTEKSLKKLVLENFKDDRGLHVHGLDVVQDKSDPSLLWVYVVNHRPQREAGTEHHRGADEAVEIFKTTPGGNSLVHVRTFDDPSVIITPNDVSGSSDGQSLFVTNDNPSRVNKVCSMNDSV
jgi:arylesterase/paraoxonase